MLIALAGTGTAAGGGLKVFVAPNPLPAAGQSAFAGSKKCLPCHESIYRHWLGSAHARAWQSLEKRRAQHDPTCLRCHSTGYGEQGGFTDQRQTPQLTGVQCEACHGPAAGHPPRKTGWSWLGADCSPCRIRRICMGCHNRTHSPDFDLTRYLERIKHPD